VKCKSNEFTAKDEFIVKGNKIEQMDGTKQREGYWATVVAGGMRLTRRGEAIRELLLCNQRGILRAERDGSVFASPPPSTGGSSNEGGGFFSAGFLRGSGNLESATNGPRLSFSEACRWTLEIFPSVSVLQPPKRRLSNVNQIESEQEELAAEKERAEAASNQNERTTENNTTNTSTQSAGAAMFAGFRSTQGKYLSAETEEEVEGRVVAFRDRPSPETLWIFHKVKKGIWAFRCQQSEKWLSVEESGELALSASQEFVGEDPPSTTTLGTPPLSKQLWTLRVIRKSVFISALPQAKFLSCELNGQVVADRSDAKQWETWTIEMLADPQKIHIISHQGYYLTSLNDGTVVVRPGPPREQEQWELIRIRNRIYALKNQKRYLFAKAERGKVVTVEPNTLHYKPEWSIKNKFHLKHLASNLNSNTTSQQGQES
jgi:hypothetical protein